MSPDLLMKLSLFCEVVQVSSLFCEPNARRPNLVWIIVRLRLFVYRLCFRSNRPTKCWTTKLSLDHCPIRFVLGLDFYFRSNRPTKCWTTKLSLDHYPILLNSTYPARTHQPAEPLVSMYTSKTPPKSLKRGIHSDGKLCLWKN